MSTLFKFLISTFFSNFLIPFFFYFLRSYHAPSRGDGPSQRPSWRPSRTFCSGPKRRLLKLPIFISALFCSLRFTGKYGLYFLLFWGFYLWNYMIKTFNSWKLCSIEMKILFLRSKDCYLLSSRYFHRDAGKWNIFGVQIVFGGHNLLYPGWNMVN